MWIAFFISVLMVQPMGRDPGHGAAFKGQCAADAQNILNPLGCFVSAMREQAVVAHADAEASGDPPQEHRERQRLPTEHEERSNCADMEQNHEKSCDPNDGLAESPVVFEYRHHF